MSTTETETMKEASIQCNKRTPLQHISLLNSGLTTKEQLKICCKPTYKIRRLKNKGAIMILVWSYLLISTYFLNLGKQGFTDPGLQIKLHLVALGITLPIAGWLADVYFGRYVVIQFSMWTMWIAFMLATASSVVAQFVDSYNNIDRYVYAVLMTVAMIGLGGFQANIIQFGVDQLHDASTNEMTSFITWYTWTNYVTGYIVQFVLGCIPNRYRNLVMCIHVSAALVLMFLFNHLLVKEPATKNPFKLVYNVVKYAIKNKHPRCRSAFTYCEDDLPSRIDFGKSKYGGPFTTEQVEDVKTFLRLLAVIAVGSCSFGEAFTLSTSLGSYIKTSIVYHTAVTEETTLHQCYSYEAFIQTFTYSGLLVIPVYEFLIFPVFHRFLAKIDSLRKFMLGVLLLIATIVAVMGFEVVTKHNYPESNNTATMYNVFNGTGTTALDYRWLAIPYLLRSISVALLGIGGIEFIISQAPYSMRRLIMGTGYGMLALSCALGIAVSIPFTERLSIWNTGAVSSGFWYALLLLVMELSVGILLILTIRWYKKRKREDVLPNEHIFAERYYRRET